VHPAAALPSGIDESVVLQKRRDACASFESLYVLSDRAVEALRSVTDSFDCYPIPSAPSHSVVWPRLVVPPDPASNAFQMKYPCEVCGRYWSVIWGPGVINPPRDATFGAFALESGRWMQPDWFGCQDVADVLRRAKLKGWDNIPWQRSAS
jgi:hypothetical protein